MAFKVRATGLGFYLGVRAPGDEFEVPEAEFLKQWSWVEIISGEFPKPVAPAPVAAPAPAPAAKPAPVKAPPVADEPI